MTSLSDSFVTDPMEVVKVGDVHEFTIIQLDTVRRRISLSLKSDAASRAGTGEKSTPKREVGTSSAGTGKRVVVVKKGSGNTGAKPIDKTANRGKDYGNNNRSRNSGSDDGMSYNPFAAFFNK